ncbi:MAG TPA: PD-(D/E)XK nuclease family protein [Candidatus Woesebacteria bacterium]|nr:PD-(D/E)XK nuclease family protein [Candidatus Woesebacteria bacterium]
MNYRRAKKLFDPGSPDPFQLSRSKIELFTQCPRCFYMDVRLGVTRPSTPPFTLNNAVDNLLKNEFDLLRKDGQTNDLMKKYQVEAIPFQHQDLPRWRGEITRFEGAIALDEKSNILVNGLVDDLWVNPQGELVIVDYKATSTEKEISLEDEYKQAYKRQMEVYQWVFRKLGFPVSDTGYFVFANATKNRPKFDGKLEFDMSIVSHKGDSSWVEPTLRDIRKVLVSNDIPKEASNCDYCAYRKSSVQTVAEWKAKH